MTDLKSGFIDWAMTGPDGSPDGARMALIFGGIFISFLAAVGAWLYYRYARERERGERRIRPAAEAAGLSYAFRDPGLRKELGGLRAGLGYEWQRYVLRGAVGGLRCAAYENVYRSKYFSLLNFFVCFEHGRPGLPEISVAPRSPAARELFNSGGLKYVEVPTLGAAGEYDVRAADEASALRVLTPAAVDFLRARPGWALEIRGGWIRVRAGKEGGMEPETLRSVLEEAAALAKLF